MKPPESPWFCVFFVGMTGEHPWIPASSGDSLLRQEQQRSNLDALVRREQHLAEQCSPKKWIRYHGPMYQLKLQEDAAYPILLGKLNGVTDMLYDVILCYMLSSHREHEAKALYAILIIMFVLWLLMCYHVLWYDYCYGYGLLSISILLFTIIISTAWAPAPACTCLHWDVWMFLVFMDFIELIIELTPFHSV